MKDDDVVIDVFVQQCCATMYTTVTLLLCYQAMGSQLFQPAVKAIIVQTCCHLLLHLLLLPFFHGHGGA